MPAKPHQLLLNLLKQREYENYICSLLIPQPFQQPIVAIRALDVELSAAKHDIKFAYWKQEMENLSHPISLQLSKFNVSPVYLRRLIENRSKKPTGFTTIKDITDWSEGIHSIVLYCIMKTLSIESVHADHCASHVGKAIGTVTLLRSTLHHLQNNECLLPSQLLAEQGISANDLLLGKKRQELKNVVFSVANHAMDQLKHAQTIKIPDNAWIGLLYATPIELYLNELEKADFDLFDPRLQKRNWRLFTRLFSRYRRRNWV